MMFRAWLAAGVALLLCGLQGAAAAPLEAYGQLPTLEDVVISPQGDRLAYVTSVQGKRTVLVQSIAPKKLLAALFVGGQKLRSLAWIDQDHIVVTTSTTAFASLVTAPRAEWSIGLVLDVKNHRTMRLLDNVKMDVPIMNVVGGQPETRVLNGRPTVFVTGFQFFSEGKGTPALFAIDAATGDTKLVEENSPQAIEWLLDAQGKAIVEADYSEGRKHWSLKLKRGGGWADVYGLDAPIDHPWIAGLSSDGQSVLIAGTGKNNDELRPFSLSTATFGDLIEPDRPIQSLVIDPATQRVRGAQIVSTGTEYDFFDPKDQADWDNVAAAFPGEDVSLVSMSDERKKLVVLVQGQQHGVVYVLMDLAANTALPIDRAYAQIGPEDIAPVKAVAYKAADGRRILAYLTLPKGGPAKGLPLVVLPHGGPAARDMPGFDWWSQALASRGYAVLQPEFRGSEGFGTEFENAGFGEWGRKMQTDLSDGVRALAKDGLIDPKRVCIVGASYGGYAALAGATLDTGVYRCAVAVAGLSDLGRFLAWQRTRQGQPDSTSLRFWDRFMGSKGPNDPVLEQISPAKHVDKVAIPILLIHGKDDTVVPIEQSQIMADALTKAGKPVQFVTLAGEDHWLSRSETRLQMLEATVKFLEANNPPQ